MKNKKETIVLFNSWGFPLILLLTEEGIYFEENTLQDLEFRWFPKDKSIVFDYDEMINTAKMCCAAFVHVKPGIKKWLLEDDKKTWLYFYHSSVIKMIDIMSDGFLGEFDEIVRLEKLWREQGPDGLIATEKMIPVETEEDARELWDLFVYKIASL